MEDMISGASQSIQAGTQVVKLMFDGFTAVVKVTAGTAKAAAAFLKWLWSQTAGQKLVRMGGEQKVFRLDAADMNKFKSLCKKFGVIYQVKGFEDGSYDVVMSDKQMDLINSIIQRLPSMREIQLNGDEIDNKAVVTVNESAVKDLEKYLDKNEVYYRHVSVSESANGERQYCYYIHPDALKFVQNYLAERAANPRTKYSEEKCGAYTGREFADQNKHVVLVTAVPEVLNEVTEWILKHPDAGEFRRLNDGSSVTIGDDALKDLIHDRADLKDLLWTENYAEYLSKPRSTPYPAEDEKPMQYYRTGQESEAQKTARLLSGKPATVEELVRMKNPDQFEEGNVTSEALMEEQEHLEQLTMLGMLKKKSVVTDDGEVLETYELNGKAENFRGFLSRDASIKDRLVGETGDKMQKVGLEPDLKEIRKGLKLVEMPTPIDETKERMEFRLYGSDRKEFVINMRKQDLLIAPNGKRYAWIEPSYDYNVYSCELNHMERTSRIKEQGREPDSERTQTRSGLDLVGAIRRGASASPQPSSVQEVVEREQQELTGQARTAAAARKNLSFEETADVLADKREKAFENAGQKNDFDGALNHSQRPDASGNYPDTILCDRKNPQNYIRIHTEQAVDEANNTYFRNDYRVYHNAAEVKQSEVGLNGRFTDERFEGRTGAYWQNLKREMQKKSGMSDDVLEFRSEQEFADYYQKFLGSETYRDLKEGKTAQTVRGKKKAGPEEGQEIVQNRSSAVKNGTLGAFEERKLSRDDAAAIESALLNQFRKQQEAVMNRIPKGGTGAGESTSKSQSPSRKA